MNTHEFQAKKILQQYEIPMPPFRVVSNVEDAKKAIADLGIEKGVVKIQVHAGGRGKAGGVKLGNSPEELVQLCSDLIGMKMVNNQTGEEGVIAHQVMISPAADIEHEYYIGATIDRNRAQAVLIASPDGGVDIEEVAAKNPERILTLPIDLEGKLSSHQLVELIKFMGWEGDQAKTGEKIAQGLAAAFLDCDASLLEINPLIKTKEGQLIALDAKLSVDDNALYRQKEIAEFYDPTQVKEGEREAQKFDLAYIPLSGTIGCMVNGAGLAMATMDIIHLHGGSPANFLDVGGSADATKVAAGFKIILNDPNVKGILVNIFGGIMNCATIAEGVIEAAKQIDIDVPLVVRLEGTNVEEGRRMLNESGVNLIAADDLGDAAKKIVEAAVGHSH